MGSSPSQRLCEPGERRDYLNLRVTGTLIVKRVDVSVIYSQAFCNIPLGIAFLSTIRLWWLPSGTLDLCSSAQAPRQDTRLRRLASTVRSAHERMNFYTSVAQPAALSPAPQPAVLEYHGVPSHLITHNLGAVPTTFSIILLFESGSHVYTSPTGMSIGLAER